MWEENKTGAEEGQRFLLPTPGTLSNKWNHAEIQKVWGVCSAAPPIWGWPIPHLWILTLWLTELQSDTWLHSWVDLYCPWRLLKSLSGGICVVQHFTQGLEIPMGTRWVLDLRESVSHVIMEKKNPDFHKWLCHLEEDLDLSRHYRRL